MPVRLNQVKGLSEIRGLTSAFQGCGQPQVGGISHNHASCCFVLSSRQSYHWGLFEKLGGRGSYSTNGFETDCLTGVKGTGIVPVPGGRSHGQCG
jgi:hypothetical protein